MIVIGAPNSSNSLRLVEVAERLGTPAHLVQRGDDIAPEWLADIATLGITAGASAPETLVREVIDAVAAHRPIVEEVVVTAQENMTFKLPRGLEP
jgi:4-hydroxy-3-methylbut-2-enyl diphosphate reductase